MKKIKVVANPIDNPIKFPADVKYFFTFDSGMGPVRIGVKVDEWAKNSRMIVIKTEIEQTDNTAPTDGMEKI